MKFEVDSMLEGDVAVSPSQTIGCVWKPDLVK